MEKQTRKLVYQELTSNMVPEDHKIGKDVILVDDYMLDPVTQYEFTATGNNFIELIQGRGTMTVNGTNYEVAAPALILTLKGQKIITHIDDQPTVQRSAILSDRFIEDIYLGSLKFNDIRMSILDNPIIPLTEEMKSVLDRYIESIRAVAHMVDNPNAVICAKHLTLALFYGPMYPAFKKKTDPITFRSPKIAKSFFDLLEKHFVKEHKIGYYAHKLDISEKYLYMTVVSATEKTPGYWIDWYLASAAKELLMDRGNSIEDVTKKLNFSSMSAFGKFFRRMEGLSPSEFRKNLSKV